MGIIGNDQTQRWSTRKRWTYFQTPTPHQVGQAAHRRLQPTRHCQLATCAKAPLVVYLEILVTEHVLLENAQFIDAVSIKTSFGIFNCHVDYQGWARDGLLMFALAILLGETPGKCHPRKVFSTCSDSVAKNGKLRKIWTSLTSHYIQ